MEYPTIIIGAGMAGVTAALELAEEGKQVVLVEKEHYLGGKVRRFNNYFPKLCPPSCGLEINFRRIRSNPRISVYTGAEVRRISRSDEGAYTLNIQLAPRLINDQCTSCGLCAEICPEDAAYVPGGLAYPMKYNIEPERCRRMDCAKCLEVCSFDAIRLDGKGGELGLMASGVVIATGWDLYDAGKLTELNYTGQANVVTNLEFEEMMAAATRTGGKLARPSDGKVPARIAFVQCAGSRDLNHLPYCSAVCCSASLKHALSLSEGYPESKSEIFYIDLRVSGRNENLLRKAENSERITLTKGKVGRIREGKEGPVLEVENILAGKKVEQEFDLVVLALGLVPATLEGKFALNKAGFFLEGQDQGISVAGCCKRPMDVSSAVKDGTAAAINSMQE